MSATPETERQTAATRQRWWEPGRAERAIGGLLRGGVILAATVVSFGGALYLLRHGAERPRLAVFAGEPAALTSLHGITDGVLLLRARAIIQLGLLLLIATPVARVALSMLTFALERDRRYVAVTAAVLALLLYSLLFSG